MARKRKYPTAAEVGNAVDEVVAAGCKPSRGEVGERLERFAAVRAVGLSSVFRQRPELRQAYEEAVARHA